MGNGKWEMGDAFEGGGGNKSLIHWIVHFTPLENSKCSFYPHL